MMRLTARFLCRANRFLYLSQRRLRRLDDSHLGRASTDRRCRARPLLGFAQRALAG
jgi:hypothetical protein